MSDPLTPNDSLDRIRAIDPAPVDEVEGSFDPESRDELRDRAVRMGEREDRAPRRRRSRSALFMPAGAVIAVVAAVAAVFLIGVGSPGGGAGDPAFAAAAVRVAEANPRLLVTQPGWSVTRADEFEADGGEIEFGDGEHQLQITWYPARYYESYLRDRAHVPGPQVQIPVLGGQGTMVRYSDTDFATMLPPEGPTFVEIRSNAGDEATYRGILDSLQHVDVDTWLSAMPASVVQPSDRSAIVDSMLEGVPVPPGMDLDALRNEDAVLDRYQLGAKVTGAVACEWLDRWVAATKDGDAAAADQSVQAMSTVRSWPILQEMESQGGWSQVLWQIAGQLEHGNLNTGVGMTSTTGDGKTYEYGPAYASGLGCDSEYKRLRDDG
jgi:hypothetical protein